MTFTVRSLLEIAELRTVSLTPGIGEDRPITRAHVCELRNPWQWIGHGALIMTTGIAIPGTAAEQREYVSGLHAAGIAAIAVDAQMPEVPFLPEALEHASQLGFPVLETAFEVPFVTIAEAVAEAAQHVRTARLQQTEQMYAAVAAHSTDDGIDLLLRQLEHILHGSLLLRPTSNGRGPGVIRRSGVGISAVSLLTPSPAELHVASSDHVDDALLQQAGSIVSSALSVKAAANRNEWLHSSLLLTELCEDAVAAGPAELLVSGYGVHPSYLVSVCHRENIRDALDEVHASFSANRVPALATIRDGQVVVLSQTGEAVEHRLASLANADSRVGVSAPFTGLDEIPSALRQARSALVAAHQSGRVMRFEEQASGSLFLPNDTDHLRRIARQVLGPLFTYDEQRGTSLMQTLRMFLEENRSWVRASERLFVHRQTLIARISRIEKIIDRDLSSMEDTTECWLAIQAAIGCGDLESGELAPGIPDTHGGMHHGALDGGS